MVGASDLVKGGRGGVMKVKMIKYMKAQGMTKNDEWLFFFTSLRVNPPSLKGCPKP